MPPKDDEDPASTKEVVTKKQKQLLNREEMDLNLIAESLGGYVVSEEITSLTGDPKEIIKRIFKGVPKVDAGPSPFDFDDVSPEDIGLENDPRARGDYDADSESDMRSGRSDPKTGGPKPQGPGGTSNRMGARIRAALRDFRKRFTSPKGQPRSGGGGNKVLGAIATTAGLQHILQNLQTFDPKYKATEDPTSPLYKRPEPEYKPVPGVVFGQRANEIGALGGGKPSSVAVKPPTLPKPVKLPVKPYVEPKPSPEPEPQVDPSQDPAKTPKTKPPVVTPKNPDGDKKKPPVVVNPPVNVGAGDDNKTGSKQGVTPLTQDQLAQVARGVATAQAMKAATSKTGKGKFKFGVPQQARGRIGRRQNPQ